MLLIQNFPEFSKSEIDVFIQTFRNFDLDGNGTIDAKELSIGLKNIGQGLTSEEQKQLMKKIGKEENDILEWPDFLQVIIIFISSKKNNFQNKFNVY